MLETTWLFVLVLGHVAVVSAVLLGFRDGVWGPVVIVAALLGLVLFAIGSMGATNVEVIAQDGSTVSQAQPAMGWYAMGMALVSGVVAVVGSLAWLQPDQDNINHGSRY